MDDDIRVAIDAIPAETSRLALADLLEPILERVKCLDPARSEACLMHIRFRFGLNRDEVDAYRRALRQMREVATEGPTKVHLSADFPGLVDLAESDGKTVFVLRNGEDLLVQSVVDQDGKRFQPPPRDLIPWLLPNAEEVERHYHEDSEGRLYEDLLHYHQSISELPSEAHFHLLVAWDFHTHLLEPVQYSPILWLFGVPERGKTRTGKGLIYVARRGIHVESLREAYLLRVAQDLKATLYVDVMDLWRKAEKSGSEDILLLRFEKGARVPRVLYPEKGPHQDTVYYHVFGATLIGTNEPIHHILETRSIPITLPQARRSFEQEVTPEAGLPFRERLVAFRARNLGRALPEVVKPAPGRLGDILKPLHQISKLVRPERTVVLVELFHELKRTRLTQKAESLEAQILLALQVCGQSATDGLVPVGDLADHINKDRSERERVSAQKVGRRLSALGFEKGRTGRNYAAVVWDHEKLVRGMGTYGLQETPETPQTPGSLSSNDLGGGVSQQETPEHPGNSGDSSKKLRLVSPINETELEDAGVSGVSRSFSRPSPRMVGEEDFEERAAIREFDGEEDRAEAEKSARAELEGEL